MAGIDGAEEKILFLGSQPAEYLGRHPLRCDQPFPIGIRERLLNTVPCDTALIGLRQLDHDAQDIPGRVLPLIVEKEAQEIEVRRKDVTGHLGHEGHLDFAALVAARPIRGDRQHRVDKQVRFAGNAGFIKDGRGGEAASRQNHQVGRIEVM